MMVFAKETQLLKNCLKKTPQPEDALSFDELLGFLFGLGMTPMEMEDEQWLPVIFGGEDNLPGQAKEQEALRSCLIRLYQRFKEAFLKDRLAFPFTLESLEEMELAALYEWVSGLDEALLLFEEFWDPAAFDSLEATDTEELYHSLMTIEGLVDPIEAEEYFQTLPDEIIAEIFPAEGLGHSRIETQIQMVLLASLPLAVETLQKHARRYGGKAISQDTATAGQEPVPEKKDNVIYVDFTKKKK